MKQKEIIPRHVMPAKTKTLVKRALKNKFKCKPAKGYKYLKNLNPGDRWMTSTGTIGILIECNTNARVIIQEVPSIIDEDDKKYYLGTKTIASETEVKEIGNVKDGMDSLSS